MNGVGAPASTWRDAGGTWLRGIAQIAFLDHWLDGLLVLAATALLSPWSAVGTALGALFAVALGRRVFRQTEWEWQAGFGAYDCAIVGLLWGSVLARGGAQALLFPLFLLLCLALRSPVHRIMAKLGLPPFALPGLMTVWIALGVFSVLGANFWAYPVPLDPSATEIGLAIACIVIGVLRKNGRVAIATMLLAVFTVGMMHWSGQDPWSIGAAGLWAFTVTPAFFAAITMLSGFRLGWVAGAIAAVAAAAVWLAWMALPALAAVPPLMAPLFIGLWVATLLCLGRDRVLCMDPSTQAAARQITAAGRGGAVVLSGAGISTAAGIPDYTAGAWLDVGVPLARYGYGAFLSDPGSRALYWAACARFRAVADQARPCASHAALAAIEAHGLVSTVVTQNVDDLHQKAGARNVVDLHGTIFKVRCLQCGAGHEWPADDAWFAGDLLCPQCNGFLKPAVIAFGEEIPLAVWQAALQAVSNCRVLLVVGTQLAVGAALNLVATARARGAKSIFITMGTLACPVFPGDIMLIQPAERALPAIARLLGVTPMNSAS